MGKCSSAQQAAKLAIVLSNVLNAERAFTWNQLNVSLVSKLGLIARRATQLAA